MSAAAIEVVDLAYRYPDGTDALAGIGFAVRPGERVALVGANGAGKSTLLLHLNGLLRGSGRIMVGGELLTDASVAAVRRRVGLLFQDPDDQLFCPSVADDVAFGPRQRRRPESEVRRLVADSLAAVGLAGVEAKHPHLLSLGQKKRAALAAVLACEPEVLVLDEPSAGLDPRGRRELIALLRGLGRTLVVASHDFALVGELCTRVVVLHRGRVLADGPPGILADAPLLAAADLT